MAGRLEKHPNPSKNKHEGLVLMRGPEPLGAGDLEAAQEGVERMERKPEPKQIPFTLLSNSLVEVRQTVL